MLWQRTAGLDEIDAEDLLQRLFSFSLLLDLDLGTRRFRLHDVIRAFLRDRLGDGLASLDAALVEAYRERCPNGWASGPGDGYFFTWLPAHLRTADPEDWRALLGDYDWIAAKLRHAGITALIADYEAADDDLRLVGGALRLSAHVLAKDPGQLPGQLVGRLAESEAIAHRRLVTAARDRATALALVPRRGSLTAPGGPLIRTLEGHGGWVNAVAVTPDGGRAVSGSEDKTLKVWDLASGTLPRHARGPCGGGHRGGGDAGWRSGGLGV